MRLLVLCSVSFVLTGAVAWQSSLVAAPAPSVRGKAAPKKAVPPATAKGKKAPAASTAKRGAQAAASSRRAVGRRAARRRAPARPVFIGQQRPAPERIQEIERALGHALVSGGDARKPTAPGQLESHYAPKAVIRLEATAPRQGEAYLAFGSASDSRYNLSPSGDLVEAAANLFRLLHEIDASGVATIAVAPIPHRGLGEAINDRLKRAAAPRPEEFE